MQELIEQLEDLIRRAIKIPATGRLLIDEGALERIAAGLRAADLDEGRLSLQVAEERDRILREARSEARRIVEEAQSQASVRVEEQGIVQAARQRARDIQQEADRAAAALRSEADQYVMNQFSAFEARLIRILREVQAGQRILDPASAQRVESGPRS